MLTACQHAFTGRPRWTAVLYSAIQSVTTVFIFRQPTIRHPSYNHFRNTFGASTVDDIGLLSALIDTISSEYAIDQDRIYSTGMSNGGFMSYELACFLSARITAIASVAIPGQVPPSI